MTDTEATPGESDLEVRLHRLSMSHHQDAASEGGDPFEDFEELNDSSPAPPTPTSTLPPTVIPLTAVVEPSVNVAPPVVEVASDPSTTDPDPKLNRVSSEPLSKFQDEGDDWDEGVDAHDDQVFEAAPRDSWSAQPSQAYVKSKIQELATVQEQAESTRDNPNILNALGMVLEAMRLQIEKAYEREKINPQDHQQLMEKITSVRELITSK